MTIKHIPIAALALLLATGPVRAAEEIAVVAGAEGGKYFALGQIICAVLNRKSENLDCEVMAMPAGDAPDSISNLVNVRDGAGDIGIARSDWQYFAVTGSGPAQFMSGGFDNIRSLLAIDTRPFTLLARRDAGITGLGEMSDINFSPTPDVVKDLHSRLEAVLVGKSPFDLTAIQVALYEQTWEHQVTCGIDIALHDAVARALDIPMYQLFGGKYRDRIPFGSAIAAMFSSDIGHWDVPEMSEVLEEAHENVEKGWMDKDQFRDFVFGNVARFYTDTNPDFFKGTSVEAEVASFVSN